MASYQKPAPYVNLTHLPTPKQEYVVNFEKLIGGLNLYAPDYQLKPNESPKMENMLWKSGALCSRMGQAYTDDPADRKYTRTEVFSGDGTTTSFTLQGPTYEDYIQITTVLVDDVAATTWTLENNTIVFNSAPASGTNNVSVTMAFQSKKGYACSPDPFWGYEFFHIGDKLWYSAPDESMTLTELCDLQSMNHPLSGMTYTNERGAFLRYGDDLFYKSRGVFIRIVFQGANSTPPFVATDVGASAYTPWTYMNTEWSTGAGDAYQPVNRLSRKRKVTFNAGTDSKIQKFSGDGTTTSFAITQSDFVYVSDVTVNGATVGNWTVSGTTLTFYVAPVSGTDNIVVTCQCAVKTYKLPEYDTGTTIDSVKISGTATTAYTFSDSTGVITFTNAPPVTVPFTSNTIEVVYTMTTDYSATVMDCPYAAMFGGNQNLCMVLGGSRAAPNAFFWNGNNVAMDPSYWPVEHYNLSSDTEDAITGFGKQQGNLVVFKSRSVGKVAMTFTTVETQSSDTVSRTYIEMDYVNINSMTGCDLPWSIQLIENNLVFANTQQGVHIILDSSAAHENNIVCISTKVNGDHGKEGMLYRLQRAQDAASFDDTKRYWLLVEGVVYCWDYELSSYKDPSWFYLTGIKAACLFIDVADLYHLGADGRVTRFSYELNDYGKGFLRYYQFATQFFRSYDRMKSVPGVIFTFRTDTNLLARIRYITDYEDREDLTDVECHTWSLVPRNLSFRDLSVDAPFAFVAKRKPGCRHIRHFAMVVSCDEAGLDMPIISAQVFYKYEGRERGYGNRKY